MKIDLNNFEKHDADIFDLTIVPLDNDIGGGRVTKEEIDIIRQYPDAKSLRISGLNQETFEYLISNYGCQFEMKELARLIAAIPGLKGTALKPYKEAKIVESRGTTTFYFLCKGKRKLIKGKDDAKLEKYILEFEEMVERFRDKKAGGEDIL